MNAPRTIYSRLIHLAAEMARRKNMVDHENWQWPSRASQRLWAQARKDCALADRQCADWAHELAEIVRILDKQEPTP